MEAQKQSQEFNSQKSALLEIPTCELIYDIEKSKKIWPVEFNNPQLIEQIMSRQECYDSVNDVFSALPAPIISIEKALESGNITKQQTIKFYDSISEILINNDYQRLVLYLPFEILPDKSWTVDDNELGNSIDKFQDAYLNAWYNLLDTQDIRANFVDGDLLEAEARPIDPPRVVKAAHLIPWLVMRGMISINEVLTLINDKDPVLRRSVADTLPVLDNMGLLDSVNKEVLFEIKSGLPVEETKEPLFISEQRKKWLGTRNSTSTRPDKDTPTSSLPSLCGPFSKNLQKLTEEADNVNDKLLSFKQIQSVYPVALLGGSRIKGYTGEDSDVDVYVFMDSSINKSDEDNVKNAFSEYSIKNIKLKNDSQLIDPKEYWAHELFNAAWIGDKATIADLQSKLIPPYFYEQDPRVRSRCVEMLEIDLLQYRLMHKGYARHYPAYSDRLPEDQEIDGQSAFYDSGYRQIATKLYINKVFIPNILPI